MNDASDYLKKHSELLVKSIGIETAATASGKSKTSLGRYYSQSPEHSARFMPVDTVARLEALAPFPHVSAALAELRGAVLHYDDRLPNRSASQSINADVIALSQRFGLLMAEYHQSIEDGSISANESKRLLRETQMLQQVLVDIKRHLEDQTV